LIVLGAEELAALRTAHAQRRWRLGETVILPDPFDVEIPTDAWESREG
jgi:hypothetical protein